MSETLHSSLRIHPCCLQDWDTCAGCRVQGTELQHDFIRKTQANASTEKKARHADVVSIKKEEIQYSLEVVFAF